MNKYEVKITKALLKKYYKRKSIHKDATVNRRIDLPVSKILKEYSSYNADLEEKEAVNRAINALETNGFITTSLLKYSEDYEKVYLVVERVSLFEQYAAKELGITPRSFVVEELKNTIGKYKKAGPITEFYIAELENLIQNSATDLDSVKEKDLLDVLSFLESNHEFLYQREASMLIFGDSKYLENNRKSQVCSILSRYYIVNGEEVFEDENLLERFNVFDTDQDVCIKGPVTVEIGGRLIDIVGLTGGVSFSVKDIDKIESITVHCEQVMTIENKTSFLRMNGDRCYIYLGGFATKPQIAFIKKLIVQNPDKKYLHFGDIDAGGFWIHKKLCEQSEHQFMLYKMSINELEKMSYKCCLKRLTDIDTKRLNTLLCDSRYSKCINYMIKNNCKLEQEIISLSVAHNKEVN